ncbi:hypothetical protein M406DRAFT_331239 [Cryphonectria parasitica EP155]|uniref:Uncharacterized protein n=1 Tax=Cryphonectria parasitica (strain ATCC 38755 / EP155) TaxID=660469 RepID=A0A9P4Y1H7_CRYP1|nr:uncharacterized protein M406DRAFT_331239 [Cryphonectria parasitica EP155]KAF3764923.1 hypothetical protein M406DRAFT_331239 [Cryphonectria parasitica EP155]
MCHQEIHHLCGHVSSHKLPCAAKKSRRGGGGCGFACLLALQPRCDDNAKKTTSTEPCPPCLRADREQWAIQRAQQRILAQQQRSGPTMGSCRPIETSRTGARLSGPARGPEQPRGPYDEPQRELQPPQPPRLRGPAESRTLVPRHWVDTSRSYPGGDRVVSGVPSGWAYPGRLSLGMNFRWLQMLRPGPATEKQAHPRRSGQ